MAELCHYVMRITGDKKKNVEAAASQVLETMSYEEDTVIEDTHEVNGLYVLEMFGTCADTVYYSMLTDFGQDVYTLDDLSKDQGVIIETFSNEPVEKFQEHYLHIFGEQKIELPEVYWAQYSLVDYEEDEDDEEYETLEEKVQKVNEEEGTNFTVDDIIDGEYLEEGGYENYGEFLEFDAKTFARLKEENA